MASLPSSRHNSLNTTRKVSLQQMKEIKILEQPSGLGRLIGPGVDLEAPYNLIVRQFNADPGSGMSSQKTISGTVSLDRIVALKLSGQTVSLILEDKRRLSICVAASGQIRALGDFSQCAP